MRSLSRAGVLGITLALCGCAAPNVATVRPESSATAQTSPTSTSATRTSGPSATIGAPGSTAGPTATAGAQTSPTPSLPDAEPAPPATAYEFQEYDVPAGSHPHDVAPAVDGSVWYTAQGSGRLGRLDPQTGEVTEVVLGPGSAPHGVVVGPDGAPWLTDGGLNAIVRVDPASEEVAIYPLPGTGRANLNTAAFDGAGALWFTGQAGVYGRLVPATGTVDVFDAPRGTGPYGICATPAGAVWFASLAGSYLGRVDRATGAIEVLEPPTAGQGARRVWSDSRGRLWVSEWNAGQLAMYDPAADEWREWPLPGSSPQPYSVYVDELDLVWLTDFGSNSLVRFDPVTETFDSFPIPTARAEVRQQLGRDGELWGAESGTDKLVVLRRILR